MSLAWQDEPFADGARRIATELASDALSRLEKAGHRPPEKAVHDARKRCKEVRAVLRLVRPGLDESAYRTQNALFRDASRLLSPIRDSHALLETFDALLAADAAELAVPAGPVRAELRRRAMAAAAAVRDGDTRIAEAQELLEAGRDGVASWSLPQGPAVPIAGLARIHLQGRRGLVASRDQKDAHVFHNWRKRVKYLWYHLQILQRLAPDVLEPMATTWKVLSDTIGDGHDLHVLAETVGAEADAFGGEATVASVTAVADARRLDLESRAVALGVRLYVEPTTAFAARFAGYWEALDELGPVPVAGGIEVVAGTGDDLDDRTIGELRTIARDREVRGRGQMTRQQLVAAVRAATSGTRS